MKSTPPDHIGRPGSGGLTLPRSVVGLVTAGSGASAGEALRNTAGLARLAGRRGYARVWFAEYHSIPSIASASPEILIAHVSAAIERTRAGSGPARPGRQTPAEGLAVGASAG